MRVSCRRKNNKFKISLSVGLRSVFCIKCEQQISLSWPRQQTGRGGWGNLAAFFCKTIYLKIEEIFLNPLTAGRSVIHFTLLGCKLKMMG